MSNAPFADVNRHHPASSKSQKASAAPGSQGSDLVHPVLRPVTLESLGGHENVEPVQTLDTSGHHNGARPGETIFQYIDRCVKYEVARCVAELEQKIAELEQKVEELDYRLCSTHRKERRLHCRHLLCYDCGMKQIQCDVDNGQPHRCPVCRAFADANPITKSPAK